MAAQDELESYQLKKKIFPGPIDVHPAENAIIVNYTAQAAILGENGQPVAGDKKTCQKVYVEFNGRIRIKSLNPNSNISSMAQGIVEKCKLIHPSRATEVEQLLYYLQKRNANADDSDKAWLKKQIDDVRGNESQETEIMIAQHEPSSLSQIETYIEGLYEEIKEKIQSTRCILQLAKIPENMQALVANESLMSALSRVLREDGRRSMELVTNIIYIFFCFSNFSEFHAVITANKVGDMCLRIADQELTRFNLLVQDIQKFEERVSFHLLLNLAEDLNIEVKMIKRDIIKYLVEMLDRNTPELLLLIITFLKKLSVFQENKDQMLKYSTKLLDKLEILRMILEYKGDRVNQEIMALGINIATVHEYSQIIVGENGLKFLLKRALKTRDPLLFKMLRNVSEHGDLSIKMRFLDAIDEMMELLLNSSDNPDLLVEILGILGNLTIPDFDWGKLAASYNLLDFLAAVITKTLRGTGEKSENISQGVEENDDILLQCIIALGTMANDENIAPMIAQTNILKILINTMICKLF
ncbi:Kinesin-associated protein 3 [Terramyces sp. JEL0728]|nr:Kinesin-associated protein 3 [Terramyces sp. JEL0728]